MATSGGDASGSRSTAVRRPCTSHAAGVAVRTLAEDELVIRRGMKISARLAIATSVVVAAPAFAADTDMKVNEVLLSNAGNAGQQFIELENLSPGPADAGYVFQVLAADGTSQVGFQPLVLSDTTKRIVVATAAARASTAFGESAGSNEMIINLNITLPAAGSACFKKSGVFQHCLTWGSATAPSTAMTKDAGPAPTDSMSLQRVSGCAGVAAPTYNAPNVATCPIMSDGMPITPDAGSGSKPQDDDGGCRVSTGVDWLGFLGLVGAAVLVRRRRRY